MEYDRIKAVAYAQRWALGRNPAYYNFDGIGGDCTNFASQCIYAGSGVMNYRPVFGWYYRSAFSRSPSWSGVQYFYNFMTDNKGPGPYGILSDGSDILPGDLVQLGDIDGIFYHTLLILSINNGIRVAAHTFDVWDKPLESYDFYQKRFIHIKGVRVQ